jgi:hypothetical protein
MALAILEPVRYLPLFKGWMLNRYILVRVRMGWWKLAPDKKGSHIQ